MGGRGRGRGGEAEAIGGRGEKVVVVDDLVFCVCDIGERVGWIGSGGGGGGPVSGTEGVEEGVPCLCGGV